MHEIVGLSRGDASAFGQPTYALRVALGERLHTDRPAPQGEVVVGVPESGLAAALGFSRASGLPLQHALIRSTSLGAMSRPTAPGAPSRRIALDALSRPPAPAVLEAPSPALEALGIEALIDHRWQVHAVPSVVGGRRVVLVAASLVTGEGLRHAVAALFEAGASEVHLRVASPPVRASCIYGVASPTSDEIAPADDVARRTAATSVGFLPLASLRAVCEDGRRAWCDACFSTEWPIPAEMDVQLPLFHTE
jgi:amidophosphoribosyltransferase